MFIKPVVESVVTPIAVDTGTQEVMSDLVSGLPSGYSVAWDVEAVDGDNEGDVGFTVSDLVIGDSFTYEITSSGGGTPVTGLLEAEAVQTVVSGIDVSELTDGTLTVSVTVTDPSGNIGDPVTDDVVKSTS